MDRPIESGYIWVKMKWERGQDQITDWMPAKFENEGQYPIQVVGSDDIYRWEEVAEWVPMDSPLL